MKTMPIVEAPVIEEALSVRDPIRVCMHYAHQTDARLRLWKQDL